MHEKQMLGFLSLRYESLMCNCVQLFPCAVSNNHSDPTSPVQNLTVTAVTGNTTNVSWVRPEIGTLHGALTHYVVVYNRTILSGETSNFTTNSEQVPAGSDPAQTDFSYQIMGLTAGSRYDISLEPCRMAVCGPAATTSTNTSNAGKSDCVQSALGTIRNIYPIFILA